MISPVFPSIFSDKIRRYYSAETDVAPLIIFRIIFGVIMAAGIVRFAALGWIHEQYIAPTFHFSYYGFGWVSPLPPTGMYAVFLLMFLAALGIISGWHYRISSSLFFLLFTYVELLDKSYYLNHYYFVSIISAILIFLPANAELSFDKLRKPLISKRLIPRWYVDILKFQIGLVYFYAGIAKINSDWLCSAMPLILWLPAQDNLPVLGVFFRYEITAFIVSWCGMLFDVVAPFALLWKRTRVAAYCVVIIFHTITGLLFQIGIFPVVMTGAVLIFFSPEFHRKTVHYIRKNTNSIAGIIAKTLRNTSGKFSRKTVLFRIPHYPICIIFCIHAVVQIVFPWRFLLYPGELFWTEEGYRFSWRVMLMEKAGTATFYVKDSRSGREGVVNNAEFLNPTQEKQMAMQPDMIAQFARFLHDHYSTTVYQPQVRVEAYATLNGRPSRLLIDPTVNLAAEHDDIAPKRWILRY